MLFVHVTSPSPGQLRENMSSTKPEVDDILLCRQRRTEPRLQATCTENLIKLNIVVYEMCKWTDKQTDTQIAMFYNLPGWKKLPWFNFKLSC